MLIKPRTKKGNRVERERGRERETERERERESDRKTERETMARATGVERGERGSWEIKGAS